MDRRIAAAARSRPETDPLTQEALALRAHGDALRAGDFSLWQPLPSPVVFEDRGEMVEEDPAHTALSILDEGIEDRAREIEQAEGHARAGTFFAIASGHHTPLALHVDDWLAEPGQKGPLRSRTVLDYRRIVEGFGAWAAKEADGAVVEKVTRRVAGRYLKVLHGQVLSAARIRTVVAALGSYWAWLERRGIVEEAAVSPWKGQAPAKLAGGNRPERERAFTAEEVVKLLSGTTDPLLSEMMRVAALTGMRVEEASRLTVAMCADGIFRVPGSKTDAARRDVPVHPDLLPIVARRCQGRPQNAYLFPELGDPNRHGERSAAFVKRFTRYRGEVGVDEKVEGQRRSLTNWHSWRRWFITAALQAGQPERVVQQVVGHKLTGLTTGTYFGGDTIEAKRACVEAVKLPVAPHPPTPDRP